jgi:NADP-dependent 3-hydroxy acid dehydrogenase YdfG
MTDARGLTVCVTGATAGFGEAIARRFHAAGAHVIATGRRQARLDALAAELGERLLPVAFDVGDRAAVFAKLEALPAPFDTVDVLVNNAGLALGLGPAWTVDVDDWDTMIRTNCNGLVYCTRALLPGMVERRQGHVINLGSSAANYPYPGGNVYGGTKAFVKQFSLNLRADLSGKNVRVTDIQPGIAETEFSVVRFGGDTEAAAKAYQGTRPLVAADIAESVFWCAMLPAHVNINAMEIMPTDQSFSPFTIYRGE